MPTILMVAASPIDQDRLRLSAEFRDIKKSLQRSQNRENWRLESNEATTVDDLRRAMLDHRPSIVHFAGHGSGSGGLCFEDSIGSTQLAHSSSLAKLFHHFKDDLKCVVLNACYSESQAEAIREEIDYLIGMRAVVNDESAIKFSVAFYDAIFAGTSYRAAFDLGCTALELNSLPNSDVPVFITGSHLKPSVLSYTEHLPEVERVLYTYFNTPFIDRAPLTTSGDEIINIFPQFYGDNMRINVDKVRVLSMDRLTSDQWRVLVEISEGVNRVERTCYVRIRDRRVLVEWEASVGYWSVPVKTFLALGSEHPVIARVYAELGTYYNFEFADRSDEFQCIRLEAEFEVLNGYVKRNSDVYKDLIEILSDGNSHALTLEIMDASSATDMPLIQRLLSKTWLYKPSDEIVRQDDKC